MVHPGAPDMRPALPAQRVVDQDMEPAPWDRRQKEAKDQLTDPVGIPDGPTEESVEHRVMLAPLARSSYLENPANGGASVA